MISCTGGSGTKDRPRFRKSFPDTYKEHFPEAKVSFLHRVKSAIPSFKRLTSVRKKSNPPTEEPPQEIVVEKIDPDLRVKEITYKALENEEYSGMMDLSKEDSLIALNLVQKVYDSISSVLVCT